MNKPVYADVYDFENIYQAAKETISDKRFLPVIGVRQAV